MFTIKKIVDKWNKYAIQHDLGELVIEYKGKIKISFNTFKDIVYSQDDNIKKNYSVIVWHKWETSVLNPFKEENFRRFIVSLQSKAMSINKELSDASGPYLTVVK